MTNSRPNYICLIPAFVCSRATRSPAFIVVHVKSVLTTLGKSRPEKAELSGLGMGRIVAVFPALLGFALAWFIKHRESGANVGPNSMSTFKAAVVEYQPVVNAEGRHGRATDLIMRNLREYAKFVLQANQQVGHPPSYFVLKDLNDNIPIFRVATL